MRTSGCVPVWMERWCWTVQWLLGTAKACMSIRDESAYSLHLYSEHRTEESSALSMQRVMHLGRKPGETHPPTTAGENNPPFRQGRCQDQQSSADAIGAGRAPPGSEWESGLLWSLVSRIAIGAGCLPKRFFQALGYVTKESIIPRSNQPKFGKVCFQRSPKSKLYCSPATYVQNGNARVIGN